MSKQNNKKVATIAIAGGALVTTALILPACTPTPNNPSDPKQPVVKANENENNSNASNSENQLFSDILYGPRSNM